MEKSHNPIAATLRLLASSLILIAGLSAADSAGAKMSSEEAAFIQKNLNDDEKRQFLADFMDGGVPATREEAQAKTIAVLATFKPKLAARGIAFTATKPEEAQAAAAGKTQQQRDLEFLQANLKPEEWQQLVTAYTNAQALGDMSSFNNMIGTFKARLAARGVQQASVSSATAYVPKSKNVRITSSTNGDITNVMVLPSGFEYQTPRREDESISADAKQVITWINPEDESKGVESAGFTTASGAKVGTWITWSAGREIESNGVYVDGKKVGPWIEREYNKKGTSQIAESKGEYANGLRTGVWQIEYTTDHPEVVKAKEKAGMGKPNADGSLNMHLGMMKGFHQTDTYVDGKVVKTTRDF